MSLSTHTEHGEHVVEVVCGKNPGGRGSLESLGMSRNLGGRRCTPRTVELSRMMCRSLRGEWAQLTPGDIGRCRDHPRALVLFSFFPLQNSLPENSLPVTRLNVRNPFSIKPIPITGKTTQGTLGCFYEMKACANFKVLGYQRTLMFLSRRDGAVE